MPISTYISEAQIQKTACELLISCVICLWKLCYLLIGWHVWPYVYRVSPGHMENANHTVYCANQYKTTLQPKLDGYTICQEKKTHFRYMIIWTCIFSKQRWPQKAANLSNKIVRRMHLYLWLTRWLISFQLLTQKESLVSFWNESVLSNKSAEWTLQWLTHKELISDSIDLFKTLIHSGIKQGSAIYTKCN